MTHKREVIGTIGNAGRKYGTDAAGIWAWICSDKPRHLSTGRNVRLIADPDKRQHDSRVISDKPTLWIVEEEETS